MRQSRLCQLLWTLGLIGLPLSHALLFARIEPFYTAIYSFLWWSFILSTDFLVHRIRGRSLLSDRPVEFLLLALWSVPVWLIFEMLNLRLQNWYYVQAPFFLTTGFVFLTFAFATVLPGVFEVADLIVAVVEKTIPGGRIAGTPFRVTQANLATQVTLGFAMLALTLLWPRHFFCLAWGFAYLILDPICYAKRGRSLLGQLATGDNTRLVALLLSGFICGLLWELWNLGARTKWVYSVPFFDELKIGEMPVLGFLGFPPFVLECYAIVNFVSLWRDGRNWELPDAENARRRGMPRRRATLLWAAVVLFTPIAAVAIIFQSVASFSVPLAYEFRHDMTAADAEALRRSAIASPRQLLALAAPPTGMEPALFRNMRTLCELSEIKGMGFRYARQLAALGIATPAQLAHCSPEILARRLGLRFPDAPPREAWVKTWVREARRRTI